jgi:hypothetical protein
MFSAQGRGCGADDGMLSIVAGGLTARGVEGGLRLDVESMTRGL